VAQTADRAPARRDKGNPGTRAGAQRVCARPGAVSAAQRRASCCALPRRPAAYALVPPPRRQLPCLQLVAGGGAPACPRARMHARDRRGHSRQAGALLRARGRAGMLAAGGGRSGVPALRGAAATPVAAGAVVVPKRSLAWQKSAGGLAALSGSTGDRELPRACAAAALTRGALSSCVMAGGGAG